MRYSLMLQLVSVVTLIFIAAAVLFAAIQNRPTEQPNAPLPTQRLNR